MTRPRPLGAAGRRHCLPCLQTWCHECLGGECGCDHLAVLRDAAAMRERLEADEPYVDDAEVERRREAYEAAAAGQYPQVPSYRVMTGPDGEMVLVMAPSADGVDRNAIAGDVAWRCVSTPEGVDPFADIRLGPRPESSGERTT